MINNYPTYINTDGFELYWQEVWTFKAANGDIMASIDSAGSQLYPESYKDWAFTDTSGNVQRFDNVPVWCSGKLCFFGLKAFNFKGGFSSFFRQDLPIEFSS